jgi:hypothetical protein
VSDVDQPLRCGRHFADREHPARVPVPAVFDDSDVDVDDVALFEAAIARNAVADDVVDGRADGFRESAVIERGRDCALHIHDVVVAAVVDLVRGRPCNDVRGDHVEDVSRQPAGLAHAFLFGGGFDGHLHVGSDSSYGLGETGTSGRDQPAAGAASRCQAAV